MLVEDLKKITEIAVLSESGDSVQFALSISVPYLEAGEWEMAYMSLEVVCPVQQGMMLLQKAKSRSPHEVPVPGAWNPPRLAQSLHTLFEGALQVLALTTPPPAESVPTVESPKTKTARQWLGEASQEFRKGLGELPALDGLPTFLKLATEMYLKKL